MRTQLHISTQAIVSMGDVQISPVFSNPKSKIKNEVCVIFVRDVVRSGARELAGDPATRIRLEIPRHLQRNLKPLESISYSLKRKHPGMRRNVKFNDDRLDLVLDFCIDPDKDDAVWKKLRPDQAKTARSRMVTGGEPSTDVDEAELDSLLDGDMGRSSTAI